MSRETFCIGGESLSIGQAHKIVEIASFTQIGKAPGRAPKNNEVSCAVRIGMSIPEYALRPLKSFLDYWEDSLRLLELSIEGLSMLKDVPKVLESIRANEEIQKPMREKLNIKANPEMPSIEAISQMIKKAEVKAEFSEKEIRAGFPLLHAHTLVGVWGALEAAIEDMLVGTLMNEPRFLEFPVFAKIRVPLAEFQMLDKEDRMRFVIEEASRNLGTVRGQGVDTFESLLEHFLLSGAVLAEIKKTIWEISNIRNVIVHRNSIADRRLIKHCTWLNMQVGDKVVISHEQLERYGDALCAYAEIIINGWLSVTHLKCN
jgi:hypothetical protein